MVDLCLSPDNAQSPSIYGLSPGTHNSPETGFIVPMLSLRKQVERPKVAHPTPAMEPMGSEQLSQDLNPGLLIRNSKNHPLNLFCFVNI